MGATQRVGSARNPTKPFVHFRGILELWGHQGARTECGTTQEATSGMSS